MFLPKYLALAVSGMLVLPSVLAAQPVRKVKPPVSQATIDLATFSGGAPMPGGGAGLVGSLFGATGKDNSFGMTQAQSPGRWMDVTLLTRNNGKLTAATQSLPAGTKLGPVLNLVAPDQGPAEEVQHRCAARPDACRRGHPQRSRQGGAVPVEADAAGQRLVRAIDGHARRRQG